MCDHKGYYLENHRVISSDGYILTLFKVRKDDGTNSVVRDETPKEIDKPRVDFTREAWPTTLTPLDPQNASGVGKPSPPGNKINPQVLIVHGLECGGLEWFCNENPDHVLPYMLMAEGYDCWVASMRGSKFSRQHLTMNPKSSKFWDFSAHEMGCFDVPAMIDYILECSGNKNLYYIGHSMGCSDFFIAMSMRPEYNSKVKLMVALAPCAYGNTLKLPFVHLIRLMFRVAGKLQFSYRRQLPLKPPAQIARFCCPLFLKRYRDGLAVRISKVTGSLMGVYLENDQLDRGQLVKAGGIAPAQSSTKTFAHILQWYSTGKFQAYDHKASINLKKYGDRVPPIYDLKKVTAPILIIYSKFDELCPPKDTCQLGKELPNVIGHKEIYETVFSHGDFLMGKDGHALVYNNIIKAFRKCSSIETPT